MGKRILITDDTMFMRMSLKEILQGSGYTIVGEAEDGKIAVEKYKKLKPDLVLMDITMPNMNGIEAIKEIMKLDDDAKIIMVSAMGQKPLIMEALCSGATDFVIKPFKPNRILNAVRKVLED